MECEGKTADRQHGDEGWPSWFGTVQQVRRPRSFVHWVSPPVTVSKASLESQTTTGADKGHHSIECPSVRVHHQAIRPKWSDGIVKLLLVLTGSILDTWVTVYSEHMGNSFGPNGFSIGSRRQVSLSK